jgi:hypothetical protein
MGDGVSEGEKWEKRRLLWKLKMVTHRGIDPRKRRRN